MKPISKQCSHCGSDFEATHFRQVFCTPECAYQGRLANRRARRRRQRAKVGIQCVVCTKIILDPHRRLVCSPECAAVQAKRQLIARKLRERPKEVQTKTCLVCGREFRSSWGFQKICKDPECRKRRDAELYKQWKERARQNKEVKKCPMPGCEELTGGLYCSEDHERRHKTAMEGAARLREFVGLW